jgi:hypothetical protein
MTTDHKEGRRQARERQTQKLSVGDYVRLAAGGVVMRIDHFEDYGNLAVCRVMRGNNDEVVSHAVRGLVKVEPLAEQQEQGPATRLPVKEGEGDGEDARHRQATEG